ncbi:MAG: hypothetical protein UIH27_09065 [Ruminococcus sp.]|nr:hypothetical protein [Ruminococcus sp.]
MMDKFQRALYGNHWLIMHTLLTVVLCIIIVGIFFILRIDINELKRLINNDTVSISAELAGFVFAGMSIFISLEGNKKIQTIKSIGKENIIYNILILSIVLLVVSVVGMLIDINIFSRNNGAISIRQTIVKNVIQWFSLYCMLSGLLYFVSSLQIIFWIFKK